MPAADYAWLPQHKRPPSTSTPFASPAHTTRRRGPRPMRQRYLCPVTVNHSGLAAGRWKGHSTCSAAPSRRNSRPGITCATARHWWDHCKTTPQPSTPSLERIECAWDRHAREAHGHFRASYHCAGASPRHRERVRAVGHNTDAVRQTTQTEWHVKAWQIIQTHWRRVMVMVMGLVVGLGMRMAGEVGRSFELSASSIVCAHYPCWLPSSYPILTVCQSASPPQSHLTRSKFKMKTRKVSLLQQLQQQQQKKKSV